MNQTGFLSGWRWGASSTVGAKGEMLEDDLKRLLNHPALQIFSSHLKCDIDEGCSPQSKGTQAEAAGELGKLWAAANTTKGETKAPGRAPSPRPSGVWWGILSNSLYLGACVSMKGLWTPPANRSTQMTTRVLYSKSIPGKRTQGNVAAPASSGFGSTPKS